MEWSLQYYLKMKENMKEVPSYGLLRVSACIVLKEVNNTHFSLDTGEQELGGFILGLRIAFQSSQLLLLLQFFAQLISLHLQHLIFLADSFLIRFNDVIYLLSTQLFVKLLCVVAPKERLRFLLLQKLALLILRLLDALRPFHFFGDFHVSLAQLPLINVWVHLFVLHPLPYDSLLDFSSLLVINHWLMFLFHFLPENLLSFLHLLQLFSPCLQLLFNHGLFFLQQSRQPFRVRWWLVLPLGRIGSFLSGFLQAALQVLLLVVFDGLQIVSLVEISDLLQFQLLFLEGRQQDLRLIALLHLFVQLGFALGSFQLSLQLGTYLQLFFMLLLSAFEILLYLLPLHLFLLLLLQFFHGLLLLLFLLAPAGLLCLQLLHASLPFLLLLDNLTHTALVLLFCEDLFELNLQVACLIFLATLSLPLFALSSNLLVQIFHFLYYGLTLGLILQLSRLLIRQFRWRGHFFGQWQRVLSRYRCTGAISMRPLLSPWVTLSAEVRVMPLASCSVKLVTSRPRRY